MTAYLLTIHLLNLLAPAAFVALVFALLAAFQRRNFKRKGRFSLGFAAHYASIFIASAVVLLAGLGIFGHDGKMLTYALMAGVAGGCQWLLQSRAPA